MLAQQSEATEGVALRSAVSARRSASRITLSAAPLLTTSSGTALMPAVQQSKLLPLLPTLPVDSASHQASINSISLPPVEIDCSTRTKRALAGTACQVIAS